MYFFENIEEVDLQIQIHVEFILLPNFPLSLKSQCDTPYIPMPLWHMMRVQQFFTQQSGPCGIKMHVDPPNGWPKIQYKIARPKYPKV